MHTVHRTGAALIGGFLILFGVVGLVQRPAMLSTEGLVVLGLSTNGLLSVLSLLVGGVLVVAALRGGPTASMVSLGVGVAFLLSAIGNIFLLGTSMNMLGFSLPNVVFSLAVGAILLILGAYGRVSGVLPPDNPYVEAGGAPPADPFEGPSAGHNELTGSARNRPAGPAASGDIHHA